MDSSIGYGHILVPTDMSDFADQAIRYAGLIATRLGSRVTLLYADEAYFPIDVLEFPLGYALEHSGDTTVKMHERLRATASDLLPSVHVEAVVMRDTPARAILRTANDVHANLIIMGTHGRHGWRRALLGSVTETVLHQSDRPLITVTPGVFTAAQQPQIRSVLCPVNFTFIARESLHHACAIASAFDAELIIVYVAEGIQPPRLPEVEAAFSLWVEPALRGRARYRLSVAGEGDPAEGVLAAARDVHADLIVLGAQHRFFSDATVIGTTTERITRFARCPVMTIVRPAQAETHVRDREEELALV
ncbi:MAG TPA: universal stress protein [Thermoanaerobaculia bacterium]|nr:universal stress protein [Thermoanaerobaculia bacterium]